MQYLLDEAEMAAVRDLRLAVFNKLPSRNLDDHVLALANVCKHIAVGYVEEGSTSRAHGCIHVKHPDGPGYQCQYCDLCPMGGICPLDKEWSK